jgi:hypothetical protein
LAAKTTHCAPRRCKRGLLAGAVSIYKQQQHIIRKFEETNKSLVVISGVTGKKLEERRFFSDIYKEQSSIIHI